MTLPVNQYVKGIHFYVNTAATYDPTAMTFTGGTASEILSVQEFDGPNIKTTFSDDIKYIGSDWTTAFPLLKSFEFTFTYMHDPNNAVHQSVETANDSNALYQYSVGFYDITQSPAVLIKTKLFGCYVEEWNRKGGSDTDISLVEVKFKGIGKVVTA